MQSVAAAADAPLYNTAVVVQRTGVPATTFRAWERRYGYPKPNRDAGGHRLYSENDIVGIRWLSEQTRQGLTVSRAVALLRDGHATLEPVPAAAIPSAVRSFAALRSDLLRGLLALDVGEADTMLAEAFALYSVEDVCLQVIEPMLIEVGERWHGGELSVADEHYITSFVRARLFALLGVYQRPDSGPLIFTACAPDEWHEVGIVLRCSVFLVRRGLAVRYLGQNLPLEELAESVERHHPAVVALSAQSRETARKLRSAASVLNGGPPPHPYLVFGGQAFNDDPRLRDSVQGTYVGPNATAASASIASMLEGWARPRPRQRGRGRVPPA